MSEIDFNDCDFYSSSDEDVELTHTSAGEYIAFAANNPTNCLPLTIYGFKRDVITESWKAMVVRHLEDTLSENWHESYGDPECLEPSPQSDVKDHLRRAIDAFCDKQEVWQCSQVAQRTFNTREDLKSAGYEVEDEPV